MVCYSFLVILLYLRLLFDSNYTTNFILLGGAKAILFSYYLLPLFLFTSFIYMHRLLLVSGSIIKSASTSYNIRKINSAAPYNPLRRAYMKYINKQNGLLKKKKTRLS